MNFLDNVYKQSLAENERNISFWQDYLNNLNTLDFSIYSDKLTVPILVPIGNKILFRGLLKHTNEVTVALGADYFAKCSIKQAEELRQHRIKDAKARVNLYAKEKKYLENQLTFNKNKVYENPGQDIIETCTEDEDRLWREQHRERVRQYNKSGKNKEERSEEITDEELWARLEELELQEELEDEYRSMTNRDSDTEEYDSFIVKDEDDVKFQEEPARIEDKKSDDSSNKEVRDTDYKLSTLDLFKQVLDKQKELEVKLTELKYKERKSCRTEKDLISKLDEMEQLDELEDEMDRLDDILNEDSDDTEEDSEAKSHTKLKKSVSFADDDESETLELNFKHSDVAPDTAPYNSGKGITKPSDIYEAYSHLFVEETASILKKTKPISHQVTNEPKIAIDTQIEPEIPKETIIVKDVEEKIQSIQSNELTSSQTRPVSLFKKRRQQKS